MFISGIKPGILRTDACLPLRHGGVYRFREHAWHITTPPWWRVSDLITVWHSRLVVILQTAPLGFDSRNQNPEIKSPDYIKILIRWTVTASLVEAFHAAFYSLRPHWLVRVTMVERPASWSHVILPCSLNIRHPSRSEPKIAINGGVPRLFFYSWANQTTYHCNHVSAGNTPREGVPRGFSTPDCFGCMIVSHTRECLGAGVCVYIYWSNLHVDAYILQVYTHEVVMCVDRCCTRSSHVSGYIYLYIRWVCLYIFTYMRTEFTCVGIGLHICT